MPPAEDGGPVEVFEDCGLDLELQGVPTISVIGPSRRGKSVLACLLAGGSPGLFAQSHSSFKAMTSGTHVCEVLGAPGALPLRIVDTEGLSHVGRSRRNEALVRQFLISTYLTSSCIIWLDTEVLSTSFLNTMWLVHDYVVDILKVRESSASSLPGLIYVRTQETEVQRREYSGECAEFGSFFSRVLEEHEDAHILTQMFAPGRVSGQALPVWTVSDLESFESGGFWQDGHSSPFKDAVARLCDRLAVPPGDATEESVGPPLMALASLSKHLPKIARLEKFDPRDHEATKVFRLRAQLKSVGFDASRAPLWLADLFDPEDAEVQQHALRIDDVARARIRKLCEALRLEFEIAEADPEVTAVLLQFERAARVFDAAVEAFAGEGFSERRILLHAICDLHLETSGLADELWAALAEAENRFLTATGLPRESLKALRLHQRVKWRIEDAIVQMHRRRAAEIRLRRGGAGAAPHEFEPVQVWSLGEWSGLGPGRGGASRLRRPEYALWTDGTSWKLYEEKFLQQRGGGGFTIGELREEGRLAQGGRLPMPL